jgi:hypothetical protein
MQKNLFLISFILIILVITIRSSMVNTMAKRVDEEPQDILYQDVIITALVPTIDKAIEDYYGEILIETPFYDSSTIKIVSIDRPNGDRTWFFNIKIEIITFIGPHIAVGKDIISIQLLYPGLQQITGFQHVDDYPLPQRYKDLYLQY